VEVKESHTYQAPVDRVLAMLSDPEALTAMYESMGHRDVEILECDRQGPLLRFRSSRVVDVDLPGFAKKVLKPTNTMLETDEWREAPDGAWNGTFDVDVKGAPVHISGTMRLTPESGSCTHDLTISVAVKVPLIGGRIADWAANNDVRRTLEGEFAFGDKWLADHPG
jgi:Protein of unknown function (DUF2505)